MVSFPCRRQKEFKRLMMAIGNQKLKDQTTKAASDLAWRRINGRQKALVFIDYLHLVYYSY